MMKMKKTKKLLRDTSSHKEVGKKKIKCRRCGKVRFVPQHVKDFICKDCYKEEEFDNEKLTSKSWNYVTNTKKDKTKSTYIEVD